MERERPFFPAPTLLPRCFILVSFTIQTVKLGAEWYQTAGVALCGCPSAVRPPRAAPLNGLFPCSVSAMAGWALNAPMKPTCG